MKNKLQVITISCLSILILFSMLFTVYLVIFYFDNYDPFGLKILRTVPLDLRSINTPVTPDQLYNRPDNWDGYWFDTSLSKTALRKLKH